MNKIALFILYNHHYTKNIDRTENLYKGKFSYVFHLIPFYSGDRENVIPVYESSIQFQSYIAQAYQKVKGLAFTHYFVVADDMILNPQINENNFFDITGIPQDASYITDVRDFYSHKFGIPLFENINTWGTEVMNILPSKETAVNIMEKNNLAVLPSRWFAFKYLVHYLFKFKMEKVKHAMYYLVKYNQNNIYPALWSYSDIILIPNAYMDNFATYCGCLAALNIFVEQAIPIALYLSSENVVLGNEIKLKQITQLYNLGDKGQKDFEVKYGFSLNELLNNYPKDLFFVHPIKLSKWK